MPDSCGLGLLTSDADDDVSIVFVLDVTDIGGGNGMPAEPGLWPNILGGGIDRFGGGTANDGGGRDNIGNVGKGTLDALWLSFLLSGSTSLLFLRSRFSTRETWLPVSHTVFANI